MTCTHDGFHSGEGRYDRGAGTLRYVLVCDDCHAEVAQIQVEAYTPAFRPQGSDAGRHGASGAVRPSAANSAS
jgi:hypothetical protein